MKLRITLLLLAAALLVAPYPSHAEPLASSTAQALCPANASTPALPGFSTPASKVLLKAIVGPKCGACSGSCTGARVGSICGVGGGGRYEFCADLGNCPQDGLTECHCQTGPPF